MLWLSWNLAQTVDGKSSTPLNAEAQFKNHTPFAGTYRDCRLNCFMSLYIFIYTEKNPKTTQQQHFIGELAVRKALPLLMRTKTPRPQKTPRHFCFMGSPVAWARWCNGLCLWRDGIIQCWFQVFFCHVGEVVTKTLLRLVTIWWILVFW